MCIYVYIYIYKRVIHINKSLTKEPNFPASCHSSLLDLTKVFCEKQFLNLHVMEDRIVFVIKNWACLRKCNYFTKLNGIPIKIKWLWKLNEDRCVYITNRKPVTQ